MVAFARGVIEVPVLSKEYAQKAEYYREHGLSAPVKPRLVELDGKGCEVLGVWEGYGYAAVRFGFHGRHGYEVVPDWAVVVG